MVNAIESQLGVQTYWLAWLAWLAWSPCLPDKVDVFSLMRWHCLGDLLPRLAHGITELLDNLRRNLVILETSDTTGLEATLVQSSLWLLGRELSHWWLASGFMQTCVSASNVPLAPLSRCFCFCSELGNHLRPSQALLEQLPAFWYNINGLDAALEDTSNLAMAPIYVPYCRNWTTLAPSVAFWYFTALLPWFFYWWQQVHQRPPKYQRIRSHHVLWQIVQELKPWSGSGRISFQTSHCLFSSLFQIM